MILNAPALVRALGGPGFVVDAVHTENPALSGFNPVRPGIQHLKILKIKEPAALAGHEQNALAAVAVDLEFHFPV